MSASFPAPHPSPISRISPSLANRLLSCGLRVAFERDNVFQGWRRPSNYSILGDAAHDLAEAVERRRGWPSGLDQQREIVEEMWQDLVGAGEERLREAWLPAVPPAAVDWPGYHLTKARTVARALRRISSLGPRAPAHANAPVRPSGPEQRLEDPETGLWGRADRIHWRGSKAQIVDLKAGASQGDPTEDQRRQLLLYAALLYAATGDWADEIAIENASGERSVLPYRSSEALASVAEVLEARDDFNRRDSEAQVGSASPDPDGCRYCEYRVVCGPYWESMSVDWRHGALWGEVSAASTASTGTLVELVVEAPQEWAGEPVHVVSVPLGAADVRSRLAVTGAIGRAGSSSMRMRWYGRARSW